MKVAIISDTHDRTETVQQAVNIIEQNNVDYLLHAGDIVSTSTADTLAAIDKVKFLGVFGNCDRDKTTIANIVESHQGTIHDIYKGNIDGKRIFMAHQPILLDRIKNQHEYDLIIFGHTHKKLIHNIGQTLVINPGATAVIIVDLKNMTTRDIPLE